jgi:hydroxyacylglutathione hydrolase
MHIHSFTVGPFMENTYLLEKEEQALLVDPGFVHSREFDAFSKLLEELGAELIAVLLTHAHVDHLLGLQRVLNVYNLPVYLDKNNRYLWENYEKQASAFGFTVEMPDVEPEPLEEQSDWVIGPFVFDILYTPGHSPDHLVFYDKKSHQLIAGDTLFREGIGRTDLYKGNFETLEKSIREKLYTLPDQTEVFPGHGPQTTIGHEKKANPFVRG